MPNDLGQNTTTSNDPTIGAGSNVAGPTPNAGAANGQSSANSSTLVPEWLKKAQSLQTHEERGALLAEQGQMVNTPKPTNLPGETFQLQQQKPISELQQNTDAQVPEWLKKAGKEAAAAIMQPSSPSQVQGANESFQSSLAATPPPPQPQTPAQGQTQTEALAIQNAAKVAPTAAAVQPVTQQVQPQPTIQQPPALQSDPVMQSIVQQPTPVSQSQSLLVFEQSIPVADSQPPVSQQPSVSEQLVSQPPAQSNISMQPALQTLGQQSIPQEESVVQQSTPVAPISLIEQKDEALKLDSEKPVKKGLLDILSTPWAKKATNLAEQGKKMLEQSKNAGAPMGAPISTASQKVESAQPNSTEQLKNQQQTSFSKNQQKVTMEERKKLIEAEKIYQQGLSTIRDLISPSSMEIKYDMLRVEGLYAQTFFVYAYPRYLDINWLSPVVNFDVTMDISQFIYPIDSAAIMTILKRKVAQMQSSIRMSSEKGVVRDPALETALEDAEELRTQIQRGQEKFFQFALYFTIYADDDKKIVKVAKQLESLLGGKLILTKKAELQMEHGFNSTLPLCLDELEVARNMNTSPLSTTFPFSSSELTSDEGILYGLNRHNDSLIIFDRFSLENANSVVFAKSGAGKSYAVKLEILRSLMLGTDVIVIDPENEYEALAQTVGGTYLRVSLTSERRINPFDLPAPLHDDEVQPGDLLRQNIIHLHGLLKIMLGGVTPAEEGMLDKALNDVYALKGITMDILDPSQIPSPTMEDLYDILSTMEGGQNLAQRLQKYTQGTYAGIFNKPTNVDMNSGLMVFSIRDLEDALRPIAMYIILNFIWNRVRSQLKRRMLVIDEAWTLMQHEDSGRFLFGLVKRARKYYLGITTITQDVEDFVKSPYGKPVITNSSMQLLLKQAPSAIDILAKVFNLTEGEKYMLLNSGVGQGLFFAGLKHVAIQIIASYSEDKIVTTDPEEILQNAGVK